MPVSTKPCSVSSTGFLPDRDRRVWDRLRAHCPDKGNYESRESTRIGFVRHAQGESAVVVLLCRRTPKQFGTHKEPLKIKQLSGKQS